MQFNSISREFLTGFHKRKLQRKKEAKENFEKDLKAERKRIKSEAKESYKKLVVSHKPIPELEDLLSEKHENEDVTVKIVELSTNDIAKQSNWIGANQPKYEEEIEESDNEEQPVSEIPGMELKRKPLPSKKEKEVIKFNSEKDIKKALKKEATKNVKKSKVFQKKNQMESKKQRKKSMQMKKQRMKIRDKGKAKKGGRGRKNVESN